MAEYKFKKTVLKGLKMLLFYGVPYAIAAFIEFHPGASSLTVGTVLTMFANYLKCRK